MALFIINVTRIQLYRSLDLIFLNTLLNAVFCSILIDFLKYTHFLVLLVCSDPRFLYYIRQVICEK